MGGITDNRDGLQRTVNAHARWVFAAARRRVGDAELAEDVAQGVFLLYWRKGARAAAGSGKTEREGKLAGWLYRAVRYCSANALRVQRIRQHHEREAAMAKQQATERSAGWTEVEGELEGALDRLSEQDRQVVLLRFYRGLSLAEVGEALGIGETAAQKRVERAVDKLREKLAAKGVETEAASLAGLVLAHAAEGGPVGLVKKVIEGIGVGNGTAGVIAQGAAKMMVMAKVKVAAVVILVAAAVGGSVAVVAETSATRTSGQDTGKVNPGIIAADNPGAGEYYVGGNVGRAGVYSLTGRQITLKQAVVSAGMDVNTALPGAEVDLIRRLPGDKERTTTMDLAAIFQGTQPDYYLQPSDLLIVRSDPPAPALAQPTTSPGVQSAATGKITLDITPADNLGDGEYYIGGHVVRVGVYSLTGRRITLKQAVVSAGGLDTKTPAGVQFVMIRRLPGGKERITTIDLDAVFKGAVPDRYLQPNDVLQVGTNPPSTAPAIPK